MATLAELEELGTVLDRPALTHLQRLMRAWGLLADVSFADLLLFAPPRSDEGLIVVGHVRPTTNQTLHRDDLVGSTLPRAQRPLVDLALSGGETVDGGLLGAPASPRIRVLAVPVRHRGEVVAVLSREFSPDTERQPGDLELTYFTIFRRLAQMVADGDYPYAVDDLETEEAPRVGDGSMVLDAEARVEFISPNGLSALHRLGVHGDIVGRRLADIGLRQRAIRSAFATRLPHTEEISDSAGNTAVIRCLPLLEEGQVSGGLVLMRDISEVRRRDRLLVSKDATIAEIHHRVKNNLQTVSSLLRLQVRRVVAPEAKAAIEESVRRIRSIAIVHEILSREMADDVPFIEILRPLLRMVEEGLVDPVRPVVFEVVGDAGALPTTLATPLAIVFTELIQNVVDHAYPTDVIEEINRGAPGRVRIELENDDVSLMARVIDDGIGIAEDWDAEETRGLGLTIVETLVSTDLGGTLEFRVGAGRPPRRGTVAELKLPLLQR